MRNIHKVNANEGLLQLALQVRRMQCFRTKKHTRKKAHPWRNATCDTIWRPWKPQWESLTIAKRGGGKASVNILIRMDVRKTLEWRSMGAKLTSVAFQSPAARGPFSGCWQGQVSRNWKQTIINNQVQVE